jgi:hypothetical protein
MSSIVVGSLYRWLEARCSEWHAEVTSDELLQSVEKKILVVAAEGSDSRGGVTRARMKMSKLTCDYQK